MKGNDFIEFVFSSFAGEPAAYVLMKHLNQILPNPMDENNNDQKSSFQLLNSFRHMRSGSLDLGGSSGLFSNDLSRSDDDTASTSSTRILDSEPDTLSHSSASSPSTTTMFLKQPPSLMLELSGIHPSNSSMATTTAHEEHSQDDKNPTMMPSYTLGQADHCACDICLEEQPMHRRLCCNYAVCDNCLSAYYEHRLQLGQFSVECINISCQIPAARDEIRALLSPKSQDIYRALLIANNDLGKLIRTCPQCNHLLQLKDSTQLKTMRNNRRKDHTASRYDFLTQKRFILGSGKFAYFVAQIVDLIGQRI